MVSAFADVHDPICATGATGSLSLSASGGSGTYRYSVNGGAFSDKVSITSLTAGEYTIIAKDVNLCPSAAISKTLVDPEGDILFVWFTFAIIDIYLVVGVSVTSTVDPECAGSSTGSLVLSAQGGSRTGYTYNVNGNNYSSSSIPSLPAGSYSIFVIDSNRCVSPVVASATLVDPQGIITCL